MVKCESDSFLLARLNGNGNLGETQGLLSCELTANLVGRTLYDSGCPMVQSKIVRFPARCGITRLMQGSLNDSTRNCLACVVLLCDLLMF